MAQAGSAGKEGGWEGGQPWPGTGPGPGPARAWKVYVPHIHMCISTNIILYYPILSYIVLWNPVGRQQGNGLSVRHDMSREGMGKPCRTNARCHCRLALAWTCTEALAPREIQEDCGGQIPPNHAMSVV